jgi:hypothetical protein
MELDQRLQRSDLDFWDRAGGNLGQFALSLVVPAGWLAKESDGVRSSLEQEIVASLAGDLANEARLRADLMSRAPSLYDYWVDPASVAIVSGSAGRELRGRLVLELGRSAERMDSYAWRLAPNSLPRTVVFDEGVRREDRAGAATRTYEFVVPLGSGPMPPEVRVEFEDASASARRRYTFATSAYASGS